MRCRQSTVVVSSACLQQVRTGRTTATSYCWQLLLIVDDAPRPLPAAADVKTGADIASPSTSRCSTGRGCCCLAVLQRCRHGLTARPRDSQVLDDATRPGVTRGTAGDRQRTKEVFKVTCFTKALPCALPGCADDLLHCGIAPCRKIINDKTINAGAPGRTRVQERH